MKGDKLISALVLGVVAGAGICSAAPKKNVRKPAAKLGRVLYIGDSITHGYGAPSYRWALHKILVDNGIAYEEIGIETGNNGKLIEPGTTYRGVAFKNLHAAMSSQRAYETSGRKHSSQRLGGTDVLDWLGLPGADRDDRKLTEKPDACFILLGTNDTLSDYGTQGGIAAHIKEATKALTNSKDGDITVIINAVHKANPKATIVLFPIPAWAETTMNNAPADYESVATVLNPQYVALAKKKKVMFIDINEGLVNISDTERPGRGVSSFFNAKDHLHPTRQGDLLMAGIAARQLGYAGRTAGLPRKDAALFAEDAAALANGAADVKAEDGKLTIPANATISRDASAVGDMSKGFTVQFIPKLGDGAANGWDRNPQLILTAGNGEHTARVTVREDGIYWDEQTMLFPRDMSVNHEAVRVAWVAGDTAEGVDAGFYVWLGDMCIGEGLPDAKAKLSGFSLQNGTASPLTITGLALDTESSAPATNRFTKSK